MKVEDNTNNYIKVEDTPIRIPNEVLPIKEDQTQLTKKKNNDNVKCC